MTDFRSRYRDTEEFLAIDSRGGKAKLTYGLIKSYEAVLGQQKWRSHLWVQGNRIDFIAHRYLGDSHLWYKIMDLNPHIPDPLSIEPGTLIRIPIEGD